MTTETEIPEEQTNQELDLGLTSPEPTPEPIPVIDHELSLSKCKPDFIRLAKALGLRGEGATQEEVEQSLLLKQTALETDLKENLVPKIQQALGSLQSGQGNQVNPKPGVSIQSNDQSKLERVTKPYTGL